MIDLSASRKTLGDLLRKSDRGQGSAAEYRARLDAKAMARIRQSSEYRIMQMRMTARTVDLRVLEKGGAVFITHPLADSDNVKSIQVKMTREVGVWRAGEARYVYPEESEIGTPLPKPEPDASPAPSR
jgi:hypothetical protein